MPGYHRFRLPEAYRALVPLTARDFAWEWLRRNPDFCALWDTAGSAARRASRLVMDAARRSRRPITDLPLYSLARRWSHWGLCFRAVA